MESIKPRPRATRSSVELFRGSLRERPIRAVAGLVVEYLMFASAVGLALGLLATRVPLRLADRAFGLGLRDRFVKLLAPISPG